MMKTYHIYSFCKINLSLRVIKKLNSGLHKIQSFITFANLYDKIFIKETKLKKDKIIFFGKFSNGINIKNNTIKKTINILRKHNFLKKNYFIVKVKKNIPHSSGLGGGSMNSANLINFFLSSYKLKISKKNLLNIAYKIGSDVPLGLKKKNTFLIDFNKNLLRTKKKLNLYVVLVKPNIKCLSKSIYFKNKQHSKAYSKKIISNFGKFFNLKMVKFDKNDLESVVFKLYPKTKNLSFFIKNQQKCIFSRMTGSGSTFVGYFSQLIDAKKAKKNILKKFPNYWCVIAKTI